MTKWLITYSQWTGYHQGTANTITKIHPSEWLIYQEKKYPEARTVLLFAMEINEEQYLQLLG